MLNVPNDFSEEKETLSSENIPSSEPTSLSELTDETLAPSNEKSIKPSFWKRRWDGIRHFIRLSPKLCIVLWCTVPIALILHILSAVFPSFADFMVQYPNSIWRWVAAKLTTWIPFSLAEMFVILIPLLLIGLSSLGIYITVKGTYRQYVRLMASLLAVISYLYTAFVMTLAPGYKGTTLDQKLDMERLPVSASELYATGNLLYDEIEPLLDSITFMPGGASVLPYDLDEMNDLLNDAYDLAADKYSFISKLRSDIKYVILSEPMSYTHITGVYTFFTGEANLNVHFPDYTLPYTAAHELAHQRGIAREDEANFVAFLATMETEDIYLRYSSYVNMLEYVMNALYSADKTLYTDLYRKFDTRLIGEFNAYAKFYEKYRENVVANVSQTINNGYLQSQGVQEGSKSYGLVVDLTVSYYHLLSQEQEDNG